MTDAVNQYIVLVQFEMLIQEISDEIEGLEDKSEIKTARARLDNVRNSYAKQIDACVDQLMQLEDPVDIVNQEFDEIAAGNDQEHSRYIELARESVLVKLDKESRKNPLVRKMTKAAPWAIGLAAVGLYFGTAAMMSVTIAGTIETREGLVTRAQAYEKVARYDDWNSTRVRRGGFIKQIILWPIEPNEAEIEGASQFAGMTLAAYQILSEDGQICGNFALSSDGGLSDEEIEFLSGVAEQVTGDKIKWEEPAPLSLAEPIKNIVPC